MIKNKKRLQQLKLFAVLLVTTFCLPSYNTTAQTATGSPYSRYGIGDLNSKGFTPEFSMGGTGIAAQNDTTPLFFTNNINPASYVSNRLTTAEVGFNFNRVKMESVDQKVSLNHASLNYFAITMPFKRWWGLSIGLLPFSSVGYKIADYKILDNIGPVTYNYDGTGGVNQVYLGNAIKPLYGLPKAFMKSDKYHRLLSKTNEDNTVKSDSALREDHLKIRKILKHKRDLQNLSLGFNTSYLFGNIDHTRRDIYPYGGTFFNTYTGVNTRFSDVYFDYGAQYSYTIDSLHGRDLKENVKLLIGATFAAQTNVNAKIDSLSYTYFTNSAGYEIPKDTIENSQGRKGKVTFPLSFGVGLGFKKGDRWTVMADFAMQNWSSYQAFDQTGGLKNTMRVSLGAQYIPNSKAGRGGYLSRIHYRIGARYAQTSLELYDTQLTEKAVSAGLGIPVGRNYLLQSFSMINVGVEYGQRGTIDNGLIKENFLKVTVGFTLNDRWFVKPKFD